MVPLPVLIFARIRVLIVIIIKAAVTPNIALTPTEQQIFSFLLEANEKLGLNSVMRVAGGWVRDKLLGKQSKDIDIAIDNMKGEDFANHLKRLEGHPAIGKSYVVKENPEQSKLIGSANVVIYGEPIDFVNLRKDKYDANDPNDPNNPNKLSRIPITTMATPQEDALRRDLTINAIFYNINTGQIEDYVNGIQDLYTMTLRTPREPMLLLNEDPLRALRWLRFLSRYKDAKIDPSLVEALASPELHEMYKAKVSPTRAFPELKKIMEGSKPGEALRILFNTGLHKAVFNTPKFRELADLNMEQKNKHHAHNLIEHTFNVMDNLNKIMISENVDPETRMLMNFAALFHDFGKAGPKEFGKPDSQRVQQPHAKRPGEMTYLQHEIGSAEVANEILKNIGLGSKARRFVEQIIRSHMLHDWPEPVSGVPSKQTTKQQRKYFERIHDLLSSLKPIEKGSEDDKLPSRSYDIGELADLAMMHVRSDILGTSPGREQEAEALKGHQQNIRDYYKKYWSSLRPLIRGDEIISLFPTINVGNTVDGKSFVVDIIERLRRMQAAGQISTKEDALKAIQDMSGGIRQKYEKPKLAWMHYIQNREA
jgi:tRNA nucleotidyltransferase/poly(A) polymerase